MKIEKLPSGSYRVRQMYKGHRYALVFDHKPTQKEINIQMSEKMQEVDSVGKKPLSFDRALSEYIEMKSNVLSPATIRGYKQLKGMYSSGFLNTNIYDINQEIIQAEVNRYALNHSPKSVRNFSGLITAVMSIKRPSLNIRTTLPQRVDNEAKIPTHDDVIKVIKELEGTEYHIAVQLACLGLRRSEIVALTLDDLDGNILSIDKAKVLNDKNEIVTKTTKTVSSTRKIYIPDELVKEIQNTGYIYKGYPNCIIRALHRAQDKVGVPRCKFHELRHYYVSYAHDKGMSDADIIKSIGHKTDAVMKRVYRHAMNEEEEQKRIAMSIFS